MPAVSGGAGVAFFWQYSLLAHLFSFNRQVKSRLGWGFLAVVILGAFARPRRRAQRGRPAARVFYRQLQAAYTRPAWVRSGTSVSVPKWTLEENVRHLALSAAMTAVLDEQSWGEAHAPLLIQAADPLREMDGAF